MAAVAVTAPAPAAAAAPTRPATVRVRPAIAGVTLVLHGRRYRSDARGQVIVPATDAELAHRGALLRARLRLPDAALGTHARVSLGRWVGRTASIVVLRPVRVVLADPAGAPVDTRVAPRVVVRGTDGTRLVLRSGAVSWLPSLRAVARPRREWRTRRVSYAVQAVPVHGVNVVHRAQQRFVPDAGRRVLVRVLFFSARFTARDALFGTPVGTGFVLRFPDGHTERHAFGRNADAVVDGLPRGAYQVTVRGPGPSLTRPVTLSRSQGVDLRVISWLDLALAATAVLLAAFGLDLWRRARIRRARRRRATATAAWGRRGAGG